MLGAGRGCRAQAPRRAAPRAGAMRRPRAPTKSAFSSGAASCARDLRARRLQRLARLAPTGTVRVLAPLPVTVTSPCAGSSSPRSSATSSRERAGRRNRAARTSPVAQPARRRLARRLPAAAARLRPKAPWAAAAPPSARARRAPGWRAKPWWRASQRKQPRQAESISASERGARPCACSMRDEAADRAPARALQSGALPCSSSSSVERVRVVRAACGREPALVLAARRASYSSGATLTLVGRALRPRIARRCGAGRACPSRGRSAAGPRCRARAGRTPRSAPSGTSANERTCSRGLAEPGQERVAGGRAALRRAHGARRAALRLVHRLRLVEVRRHALAPDAQRDVRHGEVLAQVEVERVRERREVARAGSATDRRCTFSLIASFSSPNWISSPSLPSSTLAASRAAPRSGARRAGSRARRAGCGTLMVSSSSGCWSKNCGLVRRKRATSSAFIGSFIVRCVPSNTVAAGPFIHTGLSPPAQAMVNVPPRVSTRTGESSRPRAMPATTAAQAPVPQESVSPAPRSQTRSAMRWRSSTCM